MVKSISTHDVSFCFFFSPPPVSFEHCQLSLDLLFSLLFKYIYTLLLRSVLKTNPLLRDTTKMYTLETTLPGKISTNI